jgi:hypothetical protein
MTAPFSPPFMAPFQPQGNIRHSGGFTLPRTGLIFYAKAPGMTDSIGLSANALWAALPATHRSIYLVDENTLRSAEAIITNIEASEYLNDGGELVGSATKAYAQYTDGVSDVTLRQAYRYFGVSLPVGFPYTLPFNLG